MQEILTYWIHHIKLKMQKKNWGGKKEGTQKIHSYIKLNKKYILKKNYICIKLTNSWILIYKEKINK